MTRHKECKFALVDCNNFYASCERAFDPKLEFQPVVVLSNNDGCIIARSNEAKDLGIKMGEPYFKVKDFIKMNGVVVRSSNYPLYGDMSSRVMSIIGHYSPIQEIYSIDESFLELSGTKQDLNNHMQSLKNKVVRWTGIPVCVGMGRTKVLSKLANRVAKKYPTLGGVFDIDSLTEERYRKLLCSVDVGDLWGIGRQSAKKLNNINIHSSYDFYRADVGTVGSILGVNGKRVYQELKGKSCISIESIPPIKKQIVSSRSFGCELVSYSEVNQALTSLARVAINKLRFSGLSTTSLSVFIYTNPHKRNNKCVHLSKTITMNTATNDESLLIPMVSKAIKMIYIPIHSFYKGGVVLRNLTNEHKQQDLYTSINDTKIQKDNATKSDTVRSINSRFNGSIKYASEVGNDRWLPRSDFKSKRYTTNWSELLHI